MCGCTVGIAEKFTGDKIPEPFSGCAEPPGASSSPLPLPCRMPGPSSDAVAELDQPLKNKKKYTCHMPLFRREMGYLGEGGTAGPFLGLAHSTPGLGSRVQQDLGEAGHCGTGPSMPGSPLPPWDLLES